MIKPWGSTELYAVHIEFIHSGFCPCTASSGEVPEPQEGGASQGLCLSCCRRRQLLEGLDFPMSLTF